MLEKGEEVEQQLPTAEKIVEEPTAQLDDVMDIVRQITTDMEPNFMAKVPEETHLESILVETAVMDEPTEEAEQPLLTPEEVTANLAPRNSEVARVDMEVEENLNVDWNLTERVGTSPVEGIETNIDVPEKKEIVVVTDDEEKAEKMPPSTETVKPAAAVIHTYQRRPAREEASEKRTEEERLGESPSQRTGGYVESPARSAARIPVRRRRLLMDEETEEE